MVVFVPMIECVEVCSNDVKGILLDEDRACLLVSLSGLSDIKSYLTWENKFDGLELILGGWWWELLGERGWMVGNWSTGERDRCLPRNKINRRITIIRMRIRIKIEKIMMIVKAKGDRVIGTKEKSKWDNDWNEMTYIYHDQWRKVIDHDRSDNNVPARLPYLHRIMKDIFLDDKQSYHMNIHNDDNRWPK